MSYADTIENLNVKLSKAIPALFGIPESELMITDFRNGDEYNKGKESGYILGLKYEPREVRKYAFLSIAVTESDAAILRGISKLVKANASLSPDHRSNGAIKKKVFLNGMTAYWGLLGFGPGGEDTLALVEWPSKNIDILFKLSVPSDPPLKWKLINNAEHLKIIDKGIDENLAGRLTEVFEETFAEYAPKNIEPQRTSRVAARVMHETNELPQSQKAAANEYSEEIKEDTTKPKPSSRLPWIIAGLLLVVILLLLFRASKRGWPKGSNVKSQH